MLRISASLDLETVLREVADSARALTGARYGTLVTIDENGEPQDFVTSGLTEQEHRAMVQYPDGSWLFEHLRDHAGTASARGLPRLRALARLCLEPGHLLSRSWLTEGVRSIRGIRQVLAPWRSASKLPAVVDATPSQRWRVGVSLGRWRRSMGRWPGRTPVPWRLLRSVRRSGSRSPVLVLCP